MKFRTFKIERVFSKSNIVFYMSAIGEELSAFVGITKEKMSKILEVVDESIVKDQLKSPIIKKLISLGYSEEHAENITTTFYNFYVNITDTEDILKIIESSKLQTEEKNILKDTFKQVQTKADRQKIDILEQVSGLEDYGHAHLHSIGGRTEFRPIVKDGKIVKIVSSIVITGHVHDPSRDDDETEMINFQVHTKSLEKLIKTLNSILEDATTQINEFKKQFGDDIVT